MSLRFVDRTASAVAVCLPALLCLLGLLASGTATAGPGGMRLDPGERERLRGELRDQPWHRGFGYRGDGFVPPAGVPGGGYRGPPGYVVPPSGAPVWVAPADGAGGGAYGYGPRGYGRAYGPGGYGAPGGPGAYGPGRFNNPALAPGRPDAPARLSPEERRELRQQLREGPVR